MPVDIKQFAMGFSEGLLKPHLPVPEIVRAGASRRYAVYRNNVTVGLVRTMEANFPAVRRLLGPVYFAGLAREFVQTHPPRTRILFSYGEDFAAFLAAQSDLRDFPYLADVARLEQQWRISYHAADAPILHASAFTNLAEKDLLALRFMPHPAAALLRSRYAVYRIFLSNRGEGIGTVSDFSIAEHVVVTRPRHDVQLRLVGAGTYAFLATLLGGEEFGLAVELGMANDNSFDLTAALSALLECGAFTGTAN